MLEQRLAVVINSLGTGGAETQLRSLLPELARRHWHVRVFCLLKPGPLADDFLSAGIHVESLGLRKRDPRWIRSGQILGQALRDFRPDVIHAHLTQATLAARLARRAAGASLLVDSVHYTEGEARWRAWAYRLTGGLSDATSVLSERARNEQIRLGAVTPARLVIMPNGVDVDHFARDPESRAAARTELGLGDAFTWVTVGRFVEEKDHETLVRAFQAVQRSHPDARLLVVGDGPRSKAIRELLKTHQLLDSVLLAGEVRDVRPYLNAADAFTLSSRREGLPMAVLEAMSMELPVVSTAVGSIPEVVDPDRTGLLVPPADPVALASAMTMLTDRPESSLRRMGASGREAVSDRYGVSAVADSWDRFYRAGGVSRPNASEVTG